VLLVGGNGETTVGTPTVDGAKVVAEVLEHGRDAKILVFKYKNKTRYRRRHGHRTQFTRLAIREIVTAAGIVSKAEGKPVRRPRSLSEPDADEPAAEAPEATTEAVATETPKRARRIKDDDATDEPKPARRTRTVAKPKAEAAAESAAEEEATPPEPEEESEK
jgi:large subunit ribosomal protein L21